MNRFPGQLAVALAVACGGTTSRPPDTTPTSTGAVTTVVPTETDARVSRVEELLRGVAGLEVTPLPNGSYRLRIRGQRSIRGNPGDDDPLLVIDGIPVSSASMSSVLAGLAPGDVARIEVLKDAAATGVYGARGANGVIVITTKRAQEEEEKRP
ncbi:MAG TPA: TonB-dependent receptor plug domain-containing protein [Gemmatimonadales bacterium]|jgi:iron complex outermembrane receptor protein|nr:TonB-dependent receptor plug domain-containing protein [Gemmatimonadales bacterium]